jgi:ComF family protein
MLKTIQSYLNDFTQLVYPHYCEGCGSDVLANEQLLCTQCFLNLPATNFQNIPDNTIEKMFYGRLSIVAATASYYFTKESLLQHLMHQLKYKNNKQVGVYLGMQLGKHIKESNRFNDIDVIIPLPLTAKRAFTRGYNQAALICDGIAEVLQKPIIETAISRTVFTETQTANNRIDRLENINGAFTIENESLINDRHILLVDDIITTGATLEACAQLIIKHKPKALSIATVAYTA